MKVLLVALGIYSRVGGIQRFDQRVISCLAELRGSLVKDAVVIALWDCYQHVSSVPSGIEFVPGCSGKIRTALNFVRCVARLKPDVILYDNVLLVPLMPLAKLLSPGSRQLLFVHGYEVWGGPLRPIPIWEKWLVRVAADAVVAVSGFTRDRMAQTYRLPLSRFRILHNTVDVDQPPSPTYPKPPVILSVGRLEDRYKNYDKVILALPKVLAEFPDARYRIVGDGALMPELEDLARSLGVEDRVEFLGRVDDDELRRAYQEAAVFILPSKMEGFGIVFLEAWLHGMPVIAGRLDAAAEVITDGVNGLLVDPDSVEQIASAIIRLLGNPQLAKRLAHHGYETVRNRYSHEQFLTQLATILKEFSRCAVLPA